MPKFISVFVPGAARFKLRRILGSRSRVHHANRTIGCCECGFSIAPGQNYVEHATTFGGKFRRFETHRHCDDMREAAWSKELDLLGGEIVSTDFGSLFASRLDADAQV